MNIAQQYSRYQVNMEPHQGERLVASLMQYHVSLIGTTYLLHKSLCRYEATTQSVDPPIL
jgi:hypothetical protein